MAYSHKVAPSELRARHVVQTAFGQPWSKTVWRSGAGTHNPLYLPPGTIVWGAQAGALQGTSAYSLKELFRSHGLLLGGSDDDADAMLRCLTG